MRVAIPMKTLQAVDKAAGRVACALLQPLRWGRGLRRARGPIEHVLLIKFWGIGSLQLLTPAVASLRARRPGARLCLLTLEENADFARGLEVFDEVLSLEVHGGGWIGIGRRIARLLAALRRERFDEVYDFEFFTRFSALVALLCGAPRLHGFHSPAVWRGGFHGRTVPFNRYWHVARNFRALAGGEDGAEIDAEEVAPFRVGARPAELVERLLREARHEPSRPLVVLNPNAGSLSLERRWPPERFAALAARLSRDERATCVLVGAPGERAYAGRVAAAARAHPAAADAPGRLLDLAGELDIAGLCALLARADLVVSNDSGPMHLAAALGTPTLGLFGPETPVMYRPLGPHARALWRPPICSPCINVHDNKRATCVHGRPECLIRLEVDEVLATARRSLRRQILRPVALAGSELGLRRASSDA